MADSGLARRAHQTLDCTGLYCPLPVVKTRQEMDKLAVGQILEVLADDPAAEDDLKAWAKNTGQEILGIEKTAEGLRVLILKRK